MVLDTLRGWLKEPDFAGDATLRVIAATIFMQLRNYKDALQLVQGDVENLEKYVYANCHILYFFSAGTLGML
jgi:hypothetical protein